MSQTIIDRIAEQQDSLPGKDGFLAEFTGQSMTEFRRLGIPDVKHEEWKYTRVKGLFRAEMGFGSGVSVTAADIDPHRLPGHGDATELVFVDGRFTPSLSNIRHGDKELVVMPLSEAATGEHAEKVREHLGHSASYHPDGIQALNSAFAGTGLFVMVHKGFSTEKPIYIYCISDSRSGYVFAQPRTLILVEAAAQVKVAEHYVTLGSGESFTNEIFELAAAQDAVVDYIKIQDEGPMANHVGTTHIRQTGRCLTNAVTISLSGRMVRNNLNMVMEAEHGESHMYGLSLLNGETLVDNHTIVDNVKPHCLSNELYKAVLDESSTGVFNGKIFVRKDAQKTNAYQSNKNILIGEKASANTKPQLEIFADDVKCSHGCTVGRLDEEAMFYLRARGLGEASARALLLHAFAVDILERIGHEPLRRHVDRRVSQRLAFDFEDGQ
ncbi:MAG: Fe-S cluster assembly protein SufD [Chitinophagia bacterium]|nr:Fe-S cluster assembly protein SufD [Chitinophagia bacterium]